MVTLCFQHSSMVSRGQIWVSGHVLLTSMQLSWVSRMGHAFWGVDWTTHLGLSWVSAQHILPPDSVFKHFLESMHS